MRTVLWLISGLALLVSNSIYADAGSPQFTSLGSFSNMRFTQEHQYGVEIQLWRDGKDWVGLLGCSEGLIGDAPVGLLQDIRFDPQTGRFSFRARLTLGRHFCRIHKNVPSHDRFEFVGKLFDYSISGLLKHFEALHPEDPPEEEKILLKRIAREEPDQISYHSRREWDAAIRSILKFRGPKW